jgi:hypothetical protein
MGVWGGNGMQFTTIGDGGRAGACRGHQSLGNCVSESLSHISHIKERLKDATWYFRPFGWLLIVAISGEFALRYISHSKEWDNYIDKIVIVAGFFILLLRAFG